MIKCCYKCKENKLAIDFQKNQAACKVCRKAHYELNRKKVAAYKKAYYQRNREEILAEMRASYKENYIGNKEKIAERNSMWRKKNAGKVNARTARRRAQKLQASPAWLTKEDFRRIREWYQIAKELQWLSEESLHVDHILPLQGKEVCGLHVPWNLQILPASKNLKKSNVIEYTSDLITTEVKETTNGNS